MAFGIFFSTPAFAEFEKTGRSVFVDWPSLSPAESTDGSEFEVLAIVDTDDANSSVIYVINYLYKSKTFVLGAFQCNHQFEILQSVTNDRYDIRCERKDIFGSISRTILKADDSGMYIEHF